MRGPGVRRAVREPVTGDRSEPGTCPGPVREAPVRPPVRARPERVRVPVRVRPVRARRVPPEARPACAAVPVPPGRVVQGRAVPVPAAAEGTPVPDQCGRPPAHRWRTPERALRVGRRRTRPGCPPGSLRGSRPHGWSRHRRARPTARTARRGRPAGRTPERIRRRARAHPPPPARGRPRPKAVGWAWRSLSPRGGAGTVAEGDRFVALRSVVCSHGDRKGGVRSPHAESRRRSSPEGCEPGARTPQGSGVQGPNGS